MNNPKEYIKIILIILIFILPYFFIRKKIEKSNSILNITGYDDSTIILFTQLNCKNCDEAQTYIENNFADVNIKILSLLNPENRKLFVKFTHKYNLKSKNFLSPLICIGNNYMVGWNKNSPNEFQKFMKNFPRKLP